MCNNKLRWASNVVRRAITQAAIQPVPRSVWAAQDRAWARGMDGHTGTIRHGDGADPVMRFSGYAAVAPGLQMPVGAARTLQRGQLNELPSTHGDVRQAGPQVQRILDAVGGRA